MRLTKTVIEGLETAASDRIAWDEDLPGFGVKVTPSGSRIYLVQYRPKGQTSVTRRYTIGKHGAPWKTEAAREAAAKLLARVRLGEDPFAADREQRQAEAAKAAAAKAQKAREQRERFEMVVARFIERYAKPKNRSWKEAQRILTSSDLEPWRDRAISTITKRDVVELVGEVEDRAPGAARLLFAHLRKLFGWAVEQLYLEHTPFTGLKSPALSKPRDRVLNEPEIALVWKASALTKAPYGALIRMLLLTAQRRDEVSRMRWSEIDLQKAEWLIPGERTKNGQAHTVDLSIQAIDELKRLKAASDRGAQRPDRWPPDEESDAAKNDFVFTNGAMPVSNHAKAKTELDAKIAELRLAADPLLDPQSAPLRPWRIHDLRRTAATGMASLGFAPHVVEAVLNHRSGVRGGLVAVYQHYEHRAERRAALAAWGAHIAKVAATKTTPRKRARAAG